MCSLVFGSFLGPIVFLGCFVRYNLTKPQTFPLEKPRGSNSGLRCSLVFWMSLYKDLGSGPKFFLKPINVDYQFWF